MDGYKAHNLQCSVWSCQWRFDISLEILENLETLPIKTCTSILELAKCIYLVHAPSTSTPYHLHTHHGHFSERSREINSAKRTAICWHALRGFCHNFGTLLSHVGTLLSHFCWGDTPLPSSSGSTSTRVCYITPLLGRYPDSNVRYSCRPGSFSLQFRLGGPPAKAGHSEAN